MFDKTRKLAASVVSLTASAGAGMLMGNAVRLLVPPTAGRIARITMGVGGLAIGTVVGEAFDKKVNAFLGLAETPEDDTPKE